MRGQADRLVKRALLTFSRDPKLHACTIASFVNCVLNAAEHGLAVDGKHAYAVPYWNGKKKCLEAQYIPGYRGLVVIARRSGLVKDVVADIVCERDRFRAFRQGRRSVLEHEYELGLDRGKVIGAYAILVFPGDNPDDWRYDVMDLDSINKIKARTKSRNQQGEIVGPWVTDEDEMRKKTVIRRATKLYLDDPILEAAIEVEDRFEAETQTATPIAPPASGRVSFRRPVEGLDLPMGSEANGTGGEGTDEETPADNGVTEPAHQPAPIAPTVHELDQADAASEIREAITSATSTQDLSDRAGRLMVKHRELLGEVHYGAIEREYQAKNRELSKQPAKK